MVAIDLVGAGIPLIVTLLFGILLFKRGKWRASPKRAALQSVFVVVLALIAAIEFTIWGLIYGGISIQTQLFLFTVIYPAGAIQFILFDRGSKEAISPMKPYMVGTMGIVLSDLFRTFSGFLSVSPQIFGGSGPLDGVFLCGLFMSATYLLAALVYYRLWSRRSMKTLTGISAQHAGPNSHAAQLFLESEG